MNPHQLYQSALDLHRNGQIGEAEAQYRQLLKAEPRHADALHLLGVLAHQAGRGDLAVDLIRQAIAVAPQVPGYHYNLGLVLTAQGRLDEAIAACRRALELRPAYAEAQQGAANRSSRQACVGAAALQAVGSPCFELVETRERSVSNAMESALTVPADVLHDAGTILASGRSPAVSALRVSVVSVRSPRSCCDSASFRTERMA